MSTKSKPDSPKIKSHGRRMIKLSSLRPGSFLNLRCALFGNDFLVTANFPAKGFLRAMALYESGSLEREYRYAYLVEHGYTHLGQGRRRKWWKRLPKWLRNYVCEWSKP